MAATVSRNHNNSNSAIKEEHADNESFDNESQADPLDILHHKLIVEQNDGKIQNLLCPIELVLESANYTAPLIPNKYDPDIFCSFQNVASNSYKASTPRTSSRKRKNERNHSRSPNKKRKKLHHHKHTRKVYDEDDDLLQHRADTNTHAQQDVFSYQPHLNVNSRPKRQRKKVSYKEPDPSAIAVHYVPAAKPKPKAVKAVPKPLNKPVSKPPVSQLMPKIHNESVVDNRWVQCDKCLKWRRIPTYVSDKELEGEWTCAMNKWDMKHDSCEAEEEPYDLAEEQTMKVSNGSNSSQKEKRKEFYEKLQMFYETEEIIPKRLDIRQLEMAKIGNKTVDFLQLYLEVTKRGGYQYCVDAQLWEEVFVSLSCFSTQFTQQANLSLQNLYFVYLVDYEVKHYVPIKEGSNQPFAAQQAMHDEDGMNGNYNQQATIRSHF